MNALPLIWRAAAVAVLVATVGGGLWSIYAMIRADAWRDGFAAAEAECAAERRRIEIANRNAIDAANRRLIEMAEHLTLTELQLDDYVKAIDLATGADPGGAALCLTVDGVRRLNALPVR